MPDDNETKNDIGKNTIIVSSPQKTKQTKISEQEDIIELFTKELANVKEMINSIRVDYNELKSKLTICKDKFNGFEKLSSKLIKILKKNKRKKTVTKPSGFQKQYPITDEFATFLEIPLDTKMSRSDVAKAISEYVNKHNLKNKDNGQFFELNDPLSTILRVENKTPISYFKLQKYIGHLLVK
jgi:chromatin remodeling complex protein RSC6